MTAITLPEDLQAWAEAEVAAGRAESVEAVAIEALAIHRQRWEALRKSLDDAEAEANEKGWLDLEEVFGELIAECETEIAAEEERERLEAAQT